MIQWVVIAYVLTQTSLMLSFGRVGDMFGYRRIFLFGTATSTVAFIVCALAPSYAALLGGRVIQGVGAGLILSCGPALATSLFPEAMRTQVLARYMMMFGIGSALGPSVFGLLVERFGWSAVFSFRAPIAAAAFALAWTLPRPARGDPEPFDAAGGALLALALSFMLLGLNRLRPAGPETAVLAVLAVAGFALFYRQEHRAAKPIIDFGPFREPDFAMINISNVLINLSAFSIMLLAPFYLSRIPGLSLPQAGLVLAASPFGIIVAAPMAGRLARGLQAPVDRAGGNGAQRHRTVRHLAVGQCPQYSGSDAVDGRAGFWDRPVPGCVFRHRDRCDPGAKPRGGGRARHGDADYRDGDRRHRADADFPGHADAVGGRIHGGFPGDVPHSGWDSGRVDCFRPTTRMAPGSLGVGGAEEARLAPSPGGPPHEATNIPGSMRRVQDRHAKSVRRRCRSGKMALEECGCRVA